MATKKPTAAQLAARKRFAEMAKNGTLAKKRAAAPKKKKLNGTSVKGLTKFTAKNAHVEGVKRDGTLKKGFKYVKGGKIVKIKVVKKPVAKRKPAAKKGLGVTRGFCVMKNANGSTTTYGESMTSGNPCPRGGRLMVKSVTSSLNGAKKKTKSAVKRKPIAKKK